MTLITILEANMLPLAQYLAHRTLTEHLKKCQVASLSLKYVRQFMSQFLWSMTYKFHFFAVNMDGSRNPQKKP